ncbi:hypothetical protein [Saccharicrinis sp. GN24d3]|uniref:hypothetical protein n=1 Tax=Saccharicrinis sp. GN24d3 TaxID=3458416 RepID=UPI0040367283
MKGKKTFRISKVDTDIYVKGYSGVLVYKALYALLVGFVGFTVVYLLTGPYPAVLLTVPVLFVVLARLSKIQKTLGPAGYEKKKIAKKLPAFVSIRFTVKKLIERHRSN